MAPVAASAAPPAGAEIVENVAGPDGSGLVSDMVLTRQGIYGTSTTYHNKPGLVTVNAKTGATSTVRSGFPHAKDYDGVAKVPGTSLLLATIGDRPVTIDVLDLAGKKVRGSITLKSDQQFGTVVASPDGKRAYALFSGGDIAVIDIATVTEIDRFSLNGFTTTIAVSNDGSSLYVSNINQSSASGVPTVVEHVDAKTGKVLRQVKGQGRIEALIASPTSADVYALVKSEGNGAATLRIYDGALSGVIKTLDVGTGAAFLTGATISADGSTVLTVETDAKFDGTSFGPPYKSTITVVDTAKRAIVDRGNLDKYVSSVALNADGTRVYVSDMEITRIYDIAVPGDEGAANDTASSSTVAGFPDVADANVHAKNIAWLKSKKITKPKDGKYHPHAAVTRGQMTMFLYRLTNPGEASPECAGRPFDDVTVGNTFCGSIQWAAANGVTSGVVGTKNFDPDGKVTRGQMSAFLKRIGTTETTPTCKTAPFTDVPTSNKFCGTISWMSDNSITSGVGDGTAFAPDGVVTRDQMASFLHRINNYRS